MAACQIPYSGKLSRKKTFANFAVLWLFAKVFSWSLGAWRLWRGTSEQSVKVFSAKIVFFANSRKFSPSKVSRYTVGVDWLCSKSTYYAMLHCSKNLPFMLYKCLYYAQTPAKNLALCRIHLFWQSNKFAAFLVPVRGKAFTLTFHFRTNSDCLGDQSLVSKDVGEEAVTAASHSIRINGANCWHHRITMWPSFFKL